MGYTGKLEEKLIAQDLRRKGLSYGEILRKVNVSKDTLSRWCKDILLTDEQKTRLIYNKSLGQKKGSLVAAENKRSLRIKKTTKIYEDSCKEIGKLNKRDRFIFGLALYAGEGNKSDGKPAFVNANPAYIKFIKEWFEEFCDVKTKDFRGSIWLHEGNNELQAKEYWSEISKIPTTQFHKTYVVKRKDNGRKIRKNIHEHGVFTIKFYKSDTHRRIMGWISAFLGDKIANTQEIESIPR